MSGLEPQPLEFDQNGNPCCHRYGDIYASRDGALGQARHVFLAGNALPRRWADRSQFVIVETGFGLGTNFLATWQAWREDPQRPQQLHFVSLEQHPLSARDLQSAGQFPPGSSNDPLADLRAQLAAQWPLLVSGLHRIEVEDGRIALTLALGDVLELASQLQLGADAFYLDGFAPDRNPRMWDPRLFRALARLARPDATVATYTCARAVREALAGNSFEVQRQPGFGSKRDMLTARFAPRWKMRRHEPPARYDGERHAIVVGAGLAGCSSAYALRRRQWRVTLLERAGEAARGASGLPAGLLHPLLSADDNRASRLSRSGYLFSLALLQRLEQQLPDAEGARLWAQCGVFQQCASPEQARIAHEQLARQAWPGEFAQFLDADQAAAHLGLAPRCGGTWFARGAVVAAARWCRALLDGCRLAGGPEAFAPVFDFFVEQVQRTAAGWRVRDGHGQSHEAPVLVLANADDMAPLLHLRDALTEQLGGRISLLRSPALAELRAGISGDGYLIPPLLGAAAVGASYEPPSATAAQRSAADRAPQPDAAGPIAEATARAHSANLERLWQLLARVPVPQVDGVFYGQRCVSRDRLPLAGALPDEAAILGDPQRHRGAHLPDLPRLPGLYCLSALGSRGLTLAPLLGEHLACLIHGEPAPIEVALSAAVDPARFLLRQLR